MVAFLFIEVLRIRVRRVAHLRQPVWTGDMGDTRAGTWVTVGVFIVLGRCYV
jgi:hypothetical protein